MAFCPNCGSQAAGGFCPNCGTQIGGAGSGPTSSAGYRPTSPPPIMQAPGLTDNVAGALCYLCGLITGIIFLVIAPYNRNKFVRFHAFQSIFAHIAVIILGIVLTVFVGIIATATHVWPLLSLYRLYYLAGIILWIYMMYTAYNNKKVKLPLVGDLAEKQA
jgi:uncharacterized membrane protein